MKKVTKTEEDQGGVVVLGLGAAALGIFLWLRSKRQAEAVTRQFRLQLSPSPAIIPFTSPDRAQFGYSDRAQFGFVF